MGKSDRRKQLEATLKDLILKEKELKQKHGNLTTELNNTRQAIASVELQINGPTRPQVSDHALVRYLSRGLGLDVESIRNSIVQQIIESGKPELEGKGWRFAGNLATSYVPVSRTEFSEDENGR